MALRFTWAAKAPPTNKFKPLAKLTGIFPQKKRDLSLFKLKIKSNQALNTLTGFLFKHPYLTNKQKRHHNIKVN